MHWLCVIVGLCSECLLFVMGVGLLSILDMPLIARGIRNQRQNEVRDALGEIASLAYKEVVRELVVRDADDARGIPAVVADLSVRGVWQLQTEALFDIRVVDTDAQSYASRSVNAVLASAEKRSENMIMQCRHVLLFVFHLYCPLLGSWHVRLNSSSIVLPPSFLPNGVSTVMRWVKALPAFAMLRATNQCVHGSQVKWRSEVGMEDGAGLAMY